MISLFYVVEIYISFLYESTKALSEDTSIYERLGELDTGQLKNISISNRNYYFCIWLIFIVIIIMYNIAFTPDLEV